MKPAAYSCLFLLWETYCVSLFLLLPDILAVYSSDVRSLCSLWMSELLKRLFLSASIQSFCNKTWFYRKSEVVPVSVWGYIFVLWTRHRRTNMTVLICRSFNNIWKCVAMTQRSAMFMVSHTSCWYLQVVSSDSHRVKLRWLKEREREKLHFVSEYQNGEWNMSLGCFHASVFFDLHVKLNVSRWKALICCCSRLLTLLEETADPQHPPELWSLHRAGDNIGNISRVLVAGLCVECSCNVALWHICSARRGKVSVFACVSLHSNTKNNNFLVTSIVTITRDKAHILMSNTEDKNSLSTHKHSGFVNLEPPPQWWWWGRGRAAYSHHPASPGAQTDDSPVTSCLLQPSGHFCPERLNGQNTCGGSSHQPFRGE